MMFQKRKPYRNQKILDSAEGEECTLQTEWCNGDSSTVVACHSNWSEDGKGKGQKADDLYVAYGCSECHRWLDEGSASRQEKREVFHVGMKRTWRRIVDKQVLK